VFILKFPVLIQPVRLALSKSRFAGPERCFDFDTGSRPAFFTTPVAGEQKSFRNSTFSSQLIRVGMAVIADFVIPYPVRPHASGL